MNRLALLLVSAFLFIATGADNLDVKTTQGNLRGSLLTSRKGRTIFSFRGVRFAKPPVGDLRFKAPVPLEPWVGVRNATEDGFSCPQPDAEYPFPTSEDCLFLNVFTTKLPKNGKNPNRPVVVYFHSGGWYSNTGSSVVHGPQYLMDRDLVLVVPNYRLAAFGFLSTGDGVLPGNYAMKDQVAAMRWVKQNIAAFGGDPNRVTMAGCSVGGAGVWMHMMSPMSRGLFHRGISVSPTVNTFWNIKSDPMAQAKKQASLLNCPSETSQQIADCLRKKGTQEIAESYYKMLGWGYTPVLEYTPVIETADSGEERFLTEHPLKSMKDGNFMQIPWMTGMNKDELLPWGIELADNSTVTDELYEHFDELAPGILMYENGTEKSRLATRALKQLYFHNQPITANSKTDLANMYSDGVIRYGQDITAKIVSKLSKQPVYSYLFAYQGRYTGYYPGIEKPYGVIHQDDLIYLFYTSDSFPLFKPEDPETQMVEKLTKLWDNFIHTGNPTPEPSGLLNNVTWSKMTVDDLAYLKIDSTLEMKHGMFQDRLAVWDKLFPAEI